MIDLEQSGDDVLLPLIAQPKAKRNAVTGTHDGCLKVAVTAAPERGKANKAIVQLLAASLGLKKSQVEIVAGETSQRKKCRISGVSADDLMQRISRCVASEP